MASRRGKRHKGNCYVQGLLLGLHIKIQSSQMETAAYFTVYWYMKYVSQLILADAYPSRAYL